MNKIVRRWTRKSLNVSPVFPGFLMLLLICAAPESLFAAEKTEAEKTAAEVTAPGGEKALPLSETETLNKISERIAENTTAVEQAQQVKQMASEIRQIDAEQKALIKAAASEPEMKSLLAGVVDPEVLLKAKLTQAERKKNLIEKKAAFLQERILVQSRVHGKIQFYLSKIFSDETSFFIVTGELKQIRKAIADRLAEKQSLTEELQTVSSRIEVEEKYLAAKKLLMTAAQEAEKRGMQETLILAEERLNIFRDMKALLEEKLDFVKFRITTAQEFDNLLRLRRFEVLKQEINSKKFFPYRISEVASLLLSVLLLLLSFLSRPRFFTNIQALPSYMSRGLLMFLGKTLWFLGFLSLISYAVLNVFGFRVAGIALGALYLNLAAGFILFGIVKGFVEWFSMGILRKIVKMNSAEIQQSSAVFWFVNTVLPGLLLGVIFLQLLECWALRREVTEWLFNIANYPLFQSEKVKISLWNLGRSVLAIWLFSAGARFLNGILRSFVFSKSSLDKNSQYAIRTVIRFLFMAAGLITGIQLLGIDLSALAIFSGALGVGIGFGLQDIIKNIFSGFVIFFERPIRIGDVVEVGNIPGKVKSIRTRSTIVNTFDNVSIVVPNSEFLTQRVVNWSHSDPTVRVVSGVGVAYGSDVTRVKQTLFEIAKANGKILAQPEPMVIFEEFADSALLFKLFYWVDVDDKLQVKSEINFAIYAKFQEKGITIPFPQRDLHLKSSDFGRKEKNK